MRVELVSKESYGSLKLKQLNDMRTISNNYKKMEELNKEINTLQEEADKKPIEALNLLSKLNIKRLEYYKAIAIFEEAIKTYLYSINDDKNVHLWYLYEIRYNGDSCDLFKDIISEATKKEKAEDFDGIVVPEIKYYNNELTSDIDKLKHFRQIKKQYFRYYAKYIILCAQKEKEARLNLVEKLMLKKYKKH